MTFFSLSKEEDIKFLFFMLLLWISRFGSLIESFMKLLSRDSTSSILRSSVFLSADLGKSPNYVSPGDLFKNGLGTAKFISLEMFDRRSG